MKRSVHYNSESLTIATSIIFMADWVYSQIGSLLLDQSKVLPGGMLDPDW